MFTQILYVVNMVRSFSPKITVPAKHVLHIRTHAEQDEERTEARTEGHATITAAVVVVGGCL